MIDGYFIVMPNHLHDIITLNLGCVEIRHALSLQKMDGTTSVNNDNYLKLRWFVWKINFKINIVFHLRDCPGGIMDGMRRILLPLGQ